MGKDCHDWLRDNIPEYKKPPCYRCSGIICKRTASEVLQWKCVFCKSYAVNGIKLDGQWLRGICVALFDVDLTIWVRCDNCYTSFHSQCLLSSLKMPEKKAFQINNFGRFECCGRRKEVFDIYGNDVIPVKVLMIIFNRYSINLITAYSQQDELCNELYAYRFDRKQLRRQWHFLHMGIIFNSHCIFGGKPLAVAIAGLKSRGLLTMEVMPKVPDKEIRRRKKTQTVDSQSKSLLREEQEGKEVLNKPADNAETPDSKWQSKPKIPRELDICTEILQAWRDGKTLNPDEMKAQFISDVQKMCSMDMEQLSKQQKELKKLHKTIKKAKRK